MTLSAGPVSVVYSGNGATATFGVSNGGQPIIFQSNTDIHVQKLEVATGIVTTFVEGADYSLTGGPDAGLVTLLAGNLPTGFKLAIFRAQVFDQNTELDTGGDFSSS